MTGFVSTRRQLVLSGIAAGAALSVAGAGDPGPALADGPAPPETEPEVLADALAVEHLVAFVYRRALASGALEQRVSSHAQVLLTQEQEHIAFLEHQLRRMGAPVPAAPGDAAAAERALSTHHVSTSFAGLHTQHDYLRLLVDVESLCEHAYFLALAKLADPVLLRTAAEIMGCEAQHWTLLSSWQHHGDVDIAVPYPFVAGSS